MNMMSTMVKKHIERTIRSVENDDWLTFWKNWYMLGNEHDTQELVDIFTAAGIDLLNVSYDARKEVITQACYNILLMQDVKTDIQQIIDNIIDSLPTFCGLSYNEVKDCAYEALKLAHVY